MRLHGREERVQAGKAETYQEINAEGSEHRFRIRTIFRKHAAKNNRDDEHVEDEGEGRDKKREQAEVGSREQDALQQSWDCEHNGERDEAAPEADGVDAEQSDDHSEDTKRQVIDGAVFCVGLENQVRQEKQKQEIEFARFDGGPPVKPAAGCAGKL